MKKDYSHLKGKEVWCFTSSISWAANGKNKAKGFVADIDLRKGITIKHCSTQEDMICLNKSDIVKHDNGNKVYKDKFNWYIEQIKKGTVNCNKKPYNEKTSNMNFSSCAFE